LIWLLQEASKSVNFPKNKKQPFHLLFVSSWHAIKKKSLSLSLSHTHTHTYKQHTHKQHTHTQVVFVTTLSDPHDTYILSISISATLC